MHTPTISIIIPVADWNPWVLECITHCMDLDYPDFEIRLASDNPPDPVSAELLNKFRQQRSIHVVPTGPGNPSRKRNILMRAVQSDYIALIDSDAYPRRDWLQRALPLLKDEIAIVTGPNLTPPGESLLRKISGNVMQSLWGFGQSSMRHRCVARQHVGEMPTCNMIIKREPGIWFHEDLDTGEDMVFCEEYRQAGKRILYDPDVVVYHHRRTIFRPFIRQFFYYGYYKSRLFRRGSSSAHKWQVLPALFVVYLAAMALFGFAPALHPWLAAIYLPLLVYALIISIESARTANSFAEFILTIAAFGAGHIGYGSGYLLGYAQFLVARFRKIN